jgi:dTMP kinase
MLSANQKLIVLEGVDGVGKTTICKDVVRALNKKDIDAVYFREPGSTDVGVKLRKILKEDVLDPFTKLTLFLAARNEVIASIEESNADVIVLDRFTPSTFVYQNMDEDIKRTFEEISRRGVIPDLTFILTALPETLEKRLAQKGEEEDLEQILKYQEKYNALRYNKNFIQWDLLYLNAEFPVKFLTRTIVDKIKSL